MFNDVWVRMWAETVIETRCAPEDQARALAELDGKSSAELAVLAHQYLSEWQEHVHEGYSLSALAAAEYGDTDLARSLASLAAASEHASCTVRKFLTGTLADETS